VRPEQKGFEMKKYHHVTHVFHRKPVIDEFEISNKDFWRATIICGIILTVLFVVFSVI